MIKTIKPFIDLGFHTVPCGGELKRLSNGKKTLPKMCNDWRAKYSEEFNEKVTPLGGTMLGEKSDAIAIDCDDTVTYAIFKALDPDYKFHFVSKGKKDKDGNDLIAGSIIYRYDSRLSECFSLNTANIKLDFYSNNGFVYLPTEANETKEPFELCELKSAPEAVIALLISLKPTKISREEAVLKTKSWSNNLAPQVQTLVNSKKVIPNLFRVITPKDFRDLPEYGDKGYLEPDEVPEGRGSEYLSKISAVLGADSSVDEELYINAMEVINSLFSRPMRGSQLSKTIVEPMVEERASVNGDPIWRYDESWQDGRLQLVSKRNESLEAFYDPNRTAYYITDILTEKTKRFDRDQEFGTYLETVTIDPPSRKEMKNLIPLVDVISTPAKEFGFFIDKESRVFNSFSATGPLNIFRNPETYKDKYSEPATILNFIKSLVPDNYMRNYLLRFLRRKLDKFEYTPTVLYFLGVPGAGKDTLVNILEKFVSEDGMARPTVKEFLEMYNGWMLDKYFCQLDEFGNQLVRFDDKEAALGKIKAYTGKDKVQIRQMRTDGFNYVHNIIFIMTANKNPLFIEGDDRRMALFDCPNKLQDEPWVAQSGGLGVVHERMETEINDFAYYLSTEVDNLSKDDYMSPPMTEGKNELIASKFQPGQRIAFLLANKMFKQLEDLAKQNDVNNLFNGCAEGRIYDEVLFDLYYEMTDGNGKKTGINACMKQFTKVPTTKDGMKAYYYDIPGLRGYKANTTFDAIEDE